MEKQEKMKIRRSIAKIIYVAVVFAAFVLFSAIGSQALEYVVKPGDNLETISRMFGVSVREIAALNGIEDIDLIRSGSTLIIPEGDRIGYDPYDTSLTPEGSFFGNVPSSDSESASDHRTPEPDDEDTRMITRNLSGSDISAASGSSGTVTNDAENTISVRVVNADIRDVLSALSLSIGRNIIFKGTPSNITLSISDVSPPRALDLVTKLAGLIYIEDENVIIIGDRDVIEDGFSDHVEIAEFRLRYITAETLAQQIMTLGLPVESLSVRSNNKALWVQGLPSDLVRIRQIVRMLDKNSNVELGSAEIGNCFRAIHVEYISAKELQFILAQLSLPSGFTLEGNPNTLYIYASNEDFKTIDSVRAVVDVVDNYSIEGSYFTSRKIELYRLSHITAESVISLFEEISSEEGAGLDIRVVYSNGLQKAVWLCGTIDAIAEAKSMIRTVDLPEMDILSRVEVFRLYNVTAKEMEKKLQLLAIPDLTIYTFPYSAFSKSILVSCPGDYMDTVSEMIDVLDSKSPTVTLPVDSSNVQNGSARLNSRRILISELTGIPVSSFKISSNIARDDGYRYVMYLTASPEEIQRVKDIIAEIDGV
jgi:type II secretory pathway component GspD/PulD (secretin)